MPSLRLISLIVALILFALAAAGIGQQGAGTIHFNCGWAGLFFFALSCWPGSSPK